MTTATLKKRYQVKVIAHYYTYDLEATDAQEADVEGVNQFYDESHRAEIYSSEIYDEWLECEDCGEERVEEDHKCEEEEEEND